MDVPGRVRLCCADAARSDHRRVGGARTEAGWSEDV